MTKPPDLTATKELQHRVAALRHTVATLIVWMAGSANSPIRRDEAERLLKLLDADDGDA